MTIFTINTSITMGCYCYDIRQDSVEFACKKIEEADSETFQTLDFFSSYAKDKNYVYYYGKKLENVDSKSFILYDSDYFADKYRVYNNRQVIKGSDVDTFVIIDSYYSKDKNHVYYENKIVPEADPETFGKIEKYGYYADKNYIYTKDGTIENYK